MPARNIYSNGYVVDDFVSAKDEDKNGDSDAENLGEDVGVEDDLASDAEDEAENGVDGDDDVEADPKSAVDEVKDLEMNVKFGPSNGIAKMSPIEKLASSRIVEGLIGEMTESEESEGDVSQFEPSGDEDSGDEDTGSKEKQSVKPKGKPLGKTEDGTGAGNAATTARFKRNYDTLTNGHAPSKEADVKSDSDRFDADVDDEEEEEAKEQAAHSAKKARMETAKETKVA